MSLYHIILALHNLVRWVVIITAILVLVRSYRGWLAKRNWEEQDRKTGIYFTSAMDTQMLLGLILYLFLSPWTRAVMAGQFGAVMADSTMRFFSIEHIFYMFVAVVVAHIGSAVSRKAKLDTSKHQRAAIFFSISVLLVLIAIPWGRPLFPGLGGY